MEWYKSRPPDVTFALALHGECRGEPIQGIAQVASVIMTRLYDPRWPDNLFDVLFQPSQFSCWAVMPSEPFLPHAKLVTVAQMAINDLIDPPLPWSTHFFATWCETDLRDKLTKTGTIGGHDFYRED